ncbi:MAG: hypothetical protein OEZ06_08995 [Myxococcales bacterium]|nr:hypothetical protein [Myxococcales bacterium]
MTDSSFDPAGFFEFDIAHGAVRSRGGTRVLVVSEDVLAPLVKTAVANGDLTAVRILGSQLGALIGASLGANATDNSPAEVIDHAGNTLSLFGWGRLNLERWGSALVLAVEGLPPLDEDNLAVAALLGGLFSALSSAEVACVPVADTGKYVMVDPSIAEQVWMWAKGGDSLGAIASRLLEPS